MLKEIISRISRERKCPEIDDMLVDALFYPAIKSEFFMDSNFDWKKAESRHKGWSFLDDIGKLSIFYQEINPVLSVALWGIWNAIQYESCPQSLLAAILPWQPKQRRLLSKAKALTATAAVQFSDGSPFTVSTGDILVNQESFDKYLRYVEITIKRLNEIGDSYSK